MYGLLSTLEGKPLNLRKLSLSLLGQHWSTKVLYEGGLNVKVYGFFKKRGVTRRV